MDSHEWASSLRHINCMDLEDFKECFGDDGIYLWNKFKKELGADVFEFVCYLDYQNAETLYQFLMKRMEGESDKAKSTLRQFGLI